MDDQQPLLRVVGGGLAGCEAALQLARFGYRVVLHEMRPQRTTAVHRGDGLAEIVCSNSLKSTDVATSSGLLKQELDRLGCRLLGAARESAVPAGAALAVDREIFSARVAELIAAEALIRVERGEVTSLAGDTASEYWILATGPLTSAALQAELARLSGPAPLHFYDAIAPTVTLDSLDMDVLYAAARYDRGDPDYLNAACDEETYRALHAAMVAAERAELHDFDRAELFDGCQPIEVLAATGPDTLAFGPLRPVGLNDPRTGRRPFAVVQLRRENRAGTLYGLVGFQTQLKFSEQRRVFRMIPGLARANFVRYGQLHRNFFLDTPRAARPNFALRADPRVRIAGQITGVEGYVESIASGLVTAWHLAAELAGGALPPWPQTTLIGALLAGFLFDTTSARLSPMNVNFGLLPPLPRKVRGKRERKLAKAEIALADLDRYLAQPSLRSLLAGLGSG